MAKLNKVKRRCERCLQIFAGINKLGSLQGDVTLHIWIINEWVEKIGGLDERETAVAQRRDRRIHSDP